MRLKAFGKNEPVFHVEDKAPEIYCLVDGVALISVVHPIAGQLAAQVLYPGDWFGEPAALGRRPRLASVIARGLCQVVSVTQEATDRIVRSDWRFAKSFFDLMANNAETYMLHGIDLLIQDPKVRLCSRLLTLAGRKVNEWPVAPATIPLSQDEVALASCLSRKTVNKLLGDLVAKGICELRYREIRILDVEALVRLQGAG